MKRIRSAAAVLAVVTTGAVLSGIAALARAPADRHVVVLPRVEVIAAAPAERAEPWPPVQPRGARSKSG